MKNIFGFAVALVLTFCSGAVGFLFSSQFSAWYESLNKPLFNPPAWIFFPIWIVLYVLMALALVRIWDKKDGEVRRRQLLLFGLQLLLNAGWSALFLGFHSTTLSAVEVVFLWFFLLLLTLDTWEDDKNSFWLLLPYLLWVTYAVFLNIGLWWIN